MNEHTQEKADALLEAGGCPVTIEKTMPFLGTTERYTAVLAQILVPSPPRVVLKAFEAELKAIRLINTWYVAHRLTTPQDFVLKTYLARSNDFKRWVRDSSMHPNARRLYAGKGMPRWLWVTEISEIPWMNAGDDNDRLIRGEVVIDPTSSPWVPDFLTFHLIDDSINAGSGLMATMVPADEDPEDALGVPLELPGERPYKYLGQHLGG